MKIFVHLLIVILFCFNNPVAAATTHYAVYVDAGSTGSRIHVFSYTQGEPLPTIKELFTSSVKPGLSAYADKPESVGNALKPILDDAGQFLQKQGVDFSRTQVVINILATAGMRLLPGNKQKAIYDNIYQYLKTNYVFTIGDIKTIDGKLEGLYGWLNINYLFGNFNENRQTVGSIDMGGASTQITYATQDLSKPDETVIISVNNVRYAVFSKSFLGMGQDQAREKMLSTKAASVCYPVGYKFNKDGIGKFDMHACGVIYAEIIAQQKMASQLVSMQGQRFLAYSGIYFGFTFFDIQQYDQFSYESRVNNVCSKTWNELQKTYLVDEKYLSTYCANGVYHSKLLYHTYGIDGARNLLVASQINGKAIDWTLGAALYSLLQKAA